MAIYLLPEGKGYLITSSQGNDTYAVFRREEPNEFLGSFRITDGEVDGVQITDGLDLTSHPLGVSFPKGLMVAQDGTNMEGDKQAAQNFKLISWESIASLFSPPLLSK
jgi:3-phytase